MYCQLQLSAQRLTSMNSIQREITVLNACTWLDNLSTQTESKII